MKTITSTEFQAKLDDMVERAESQASSSSPAAGSAWLPISTAPQDGTKIDVWLAKAHRRVTNCYWGRPQHTCGEYEGYCDSCPEHDGWVDGEDFMYGYTTEQPTHWMPVPMPPPNKEAHQPSRSED